jgi:hypothetical protein
VGECITFVGLEVHKATIAVCVAEAGRDGEVRFVGEISNAPAALDKLAVRLGRGGSERLKVSDRRGCSPNARQMRQTMVWLMPTRPHHRRLARSAATDEVLQHFLLLLLLRQHHRCRSRATCHGRLPSETPSPTPRPKCP